jgi:hypothetical protein
VCEPGLTNEPALTALLPSDLDLVVSKLSDFLDSFQNAYNEWCASGVLSAPEISLDKIYGDCTDVLVNLLNIVDRYVLLF